MHSWLEKHAREIHEIRKENWMYLRTNTAGLVRFKRFHWHKKHLFRWMF
jgi:hypothetical protein